MMREQETTACGRICAQLVHGAVTFGARKQRGLLPSWGRAACRLVMLPVCLMLLLAGCNDDPPPAVKADKPALPVAGVFLYKKDDYLSVVTQKMANALEGKAVIQVQEANFDQITQTRQIQEFIEKKPQVLLVNLVNVQAAADIMDKARTAGIPVIFFNREPDLNVVKMYRKACFVGTKTADAGILQGDIIKNLWELHPEYDRNNDGIFQYVMLQGPRDNPEAVARTEYSVKQALAHGVNMQQVGETHVSDWDETTTAETMRQTLGLYGHSIELVISNNDSMAMGAISALQERGFNRKGGPAAKFIPVIGVDAMPRAVEAIKDGIMSATVIQDTTDMADAIVTLTLNAIAGQEYLVGSNYTWDSSGVAIRIPYRPYTPEQ